MPRRKPVDQTRRYTRKSWSACPSVGQVRDAGGGGQVFLSPKPPNFMGFSICGLALMPEADTKL
jgi:hypothetical protein